MMMDGCRSEMGRPSKADDRPAFGSNKPEQMEAAFVAEGAGEFEQLIAHHHSKPIEWLFTSSRRTWGSTPVVGICAFYGFRNGMPVRVEHFGDRHVRREVFWRS